MSSPVAFSMATILLVCMLGACGSTEKLGPPVPSQATIDTYPAWSPDGSAIAYYRSRPSTAGPRGIYGIRSDGTKNHLLLPSPLGTRHLRFSPDSTRLSFTVGLEIYIFDLRVQTLRQLTSSWENAESGDWSPDSRFLVYSGPNIRPGEPDDGGLHVIDVATGVDRLLSHDGRRVYGYDPRWSPAGEPIVFWASDNAANHDIFTIRSDGSELHRLTTSDGEFADGPRWLYGGSHFLYLWAAHDPSPPRTRIMRVDGSEPATWPFNIGRYDDVSPDSRYLATHGSQDDSTIVLFIRDMDDADGTSLRQLTSYGPPLPSAFLTASEDAREVDSDAYAHLAMWRCAVSPYCPDGISPRGAPADADH